MWLTKYALAVPKNLGLGLNFRSRSEGWASVVRDILCRDKFFVPALTPALPCMYCLIKYIFGPQFFFSVVLRAAHMAKNYPQILILSILSAFGSFFGRIKDIINLLSRYTDF